MKQQKQKANRKTFLSLLLCLLSRGKPKQVPVLLQERIDCCQTIEQLKTLLLSKEVVLDETMMAAFDNRIEELEQSTGQPFSF